MAISYLPAPPNARKCRPSSRLTASCCPIVRRASSSPRMESQGGRPPPSSKSQGHRWLPIGAPQIESEVSDLQAFLALAPSSAPLGTIAGDSACSTSLASVGVPGGRPTGHWSSRGTDDSRSEPYIWIRRWRFAGVLSRAPSSAALSTVTALSAFRRRIARLLRHDDDRHPHGGRRCPRRDRGGDRDRQR